jgi:hypothetical protein
VAVRALGAVDFPLYDVGSEIGYVVKPNQHGLFGYTNEWFFNDKSMPIQSDWHPDGHSNVLIIGNSVVMGGNAYREQDKLTPRLQAHLGSNPVVWPIAAGGWTEVNEIVYLDRHPEVVAKADYVAWEYMAGGLSRATPWAGEYVFPSHRPAYATWYILRRYLMPKLLPSFGRSEVPVTGDPESSWIESFDKHLGALTNPAHRPKPGLIWLYPTAAQLADARNQREWLPERSLITQAAAKNGLRVVDLSSYERWDRSLYRADGVHPTAEGNEVLASILSAEVAKDFK